MLFVCLRNFSENFTSFTFVIFMKSFMIEPTHQDYLALSLGMKILFRYSHLTTVSGSMSEALSGSWRKQSLTVNASVLLATGA